MQQLNNNYKLGNMRFIKYQIFAFSLLFVWSTQAQQDNTFEINKSTGKIHIENINKLEIEGYDGNKIIITAESGSSNTSDRAKGLSAINSSGIKDNTGIGLYVKEEGDEVRISPIHNSLMKGSGEYHIKLPKKMAVAFEHSAVNMDKIYLHNLVGEIEIDLNYGSVKLENVSGPLAINTVYGEIEANISQINASAPCTLYSVYGLVDVTVPNGAKLDLHLSSPYGSMFTDFDIKVPANGKLSSSEVRGTINGGGAEWRINSGYQNVYLRKQ